MLKLPNGKPLDSNLIEAAMQDADTGNAYYLNLQTGEITLISLSLHTIEEQEALLEEIETSEDYVAIERIPSHEAYQWMEAFVAEIAAPKDAQVAEQLSQALRGKGAFRRFKEVLHLMGDEWVQTWYRWHENRLSQAMKGWLEQLPVAITEDVADE